MFSSLREFLCHHPVLPPTCCCVVTSPQDLENFLVVALIVNLMLSSRSFPLWSCLYLIVAWVSEWFRTDIPPPLCDDVGKLEMGFGDLSDPSLFLYALQMSLLPPSLFFLNLSLLVVLSFRPLFIHSFIQLFIAWYERGLPLVSSWYQHVRLS